MHENLVRIKAVNQVLKGLDQDFVFVGGATVSLYATDAALATEVRPTDDVDVVVELAGYRGYSGLDEKLGEIGFMNDVSSNVICRYKLNRLIVDIMPTNPDIIGFSNKWYPEGFATAINVMLDDETIIKCFSLPYFLATKWEAFKGRGANDYRTSKDFEDIVYILENVDDFEEQMSTAPAHLKEYFYEVFQGIVHKDDFEEGIYAHLGGGYGGIDANYIILRLQTAFGLPD
jgi:predicted nucleotidyltransferase